MTSAERLRAARDALSSAFEHLDAVTGLDELEAGAVLALRADVGEAIRRLGNLIVFTERAER